MHNTDKSNTFITETPNNWDFPWPQQFSQISCNFICGFTRVKCKYFSHHAKILCSIILQNKSCTNYHNCCRKFIKLGTSHNRNFNSNLWEILTHCKTKFGIFLKCHGYCHTIIANCCDANCQKKQLIAHKVYCKEKCTKVLHTWDFLSPTHFMISGVTNTIGSISQGEQQLNISNKKVNLCTNTKNTNYLLITQKFNKWLILLAQKAAFQLIYSTCNHYQMQEDNLQCIARFQMTFSCQMGKTLSSARLSTLGLLID